jgi:hypothetical protein
MTKSYSIEALDDVATLAGMLVKIGGKFPLLPERRRVWLDIKVGGAPALYAGPANDVFEPTKDYWLDMAALAENLNLQLLEHAANFGHGGSPIRRVSHEASAKSSI